ncbi:hypothetical protein BOTBODRAFT_172898 [Botryobasidium botryosum FD-172 SS1]|uniref:Uncharacterized protein n=1 Tax=Botryobasidium botryosum (strain FD-172 SS1) TaxID=930990 RepID=A0A067MQ22_BOTB1|nr:hypothetical protein BOTBODRAFT_172898 [Botryobasidium botryosum FD-172 SS1]
MNTVKPRSIIDILSDFLQDEAYFGDMDTSVPAATSSCSIQTSSVHVSNPRHRLPSPIAPAHSRAFPCFPAFGEEDKMRKHPGAKPSAPAGRHEADYGTGLSSPACTLASKEIIHRADRVNGSAHHPQFGARSLPSATDARRGQGTNPIDVMCSDKTRLSITMLDESSQTSLRNTPHHLPQTSSYDNVSEVSRDASLCVARPSSPTPSAWKCTFSVASNLGSGFPIVEDDDDSDSDDDSISSGDSPFSASSPCDDDSDTSVSDDEEDDEVISSPCWTCTRPGLKSGSSISVVDLLQDVGEKGTSDGELSSRAPNARHPSKQLPQPADGEATRSIDLSCNTQTKPTSSAPHTPDYFNGVAIPTICITPPSPRSSSASLPSTTLPPQNEMFGQRLVVPGASVYNSSLRWIQGYPWIFDRGTWKNAMFMSNDRSVLESESAPGWYVLEGASWRRVRHR